MRKTRKSNLKKKCDALWRDIIKERSGWRSEVSGECGSYSDNGKVIGLEAHHIVGKPTYSLRYDLDNGICLTTKEHIFGVHSSDPYVAQTYQHKIREAIGEERWNRLVEKRQKPELKVNIEIVYAKLKNIWENLRNEKRKLGA